MRQVLLKCLVSGSMDPDPSPVNALSFSGRGVPRPRREGCLSIAEKIRITLASIPTAKDAPSPCRGPHRSRLVYVLSLEPLVHPMARHAPLGSPLVASSLR